MTSVVAYFRPLAALGLAALVAVPLALVGDSSARAAVPTVGLGVLGGYAVLGNSAVTNTGPTVLGGNLGVSPGTAISGFDTPGGPGVVVGGSIYVPPASDSARAAAGTAYDDAAGRTGTLLPAVELGGKNLVGGVYTAGDTGTFGLTGTLTLTGSATDVWIFQTDTTLITAAASSIVLAGGAKACNVFWKVGTSATLGASSSFAGTILAAASISLGDDVDVTGRLIAGTGAVTLINDVVTRPLCSTPAEDAAAAAAIAAAAQAAAEAAAQAAADAKALADQKAAAAAAAAQALADAIAAQQAADDAAVGALPDSPEAIAAAEAAAAVVAAQLAAAEAAAEAEEAAVQAALVKSMAETAAVRVAETAERARLAALAAAEQAQLAASGSDPVPALTLGLGSLLAGAALVLFSLRQRSVSVVRAAGERPSQR